MQVRGVRVRPGVRLGLKAGPSSVDVSGQDRVVRRWVSQHAVQQGDLVYAVHVEVNGVDHARAVWVVVTGAGLVRCVTYPPVGGTSACWPCLVDLVSEPT